MMTEVAAAASRVTVKPGAGAAKGAGGAADAGAMLDGAFAALLGAAATGESGLVAATPGEGTPMGCGLVMGEPGTVNGDAVAADFAGLLPKPGGEMTGEGEGKGMGEGETIDPSAAKPRKSEDASAEAEAVAGQQQAMFAAAPMPDLQIVADAKGKAAVAVDAASAVKGDPAAAEAAAPETRTPEIPADALKALAAEAKPTGEQAKLADAATAKATTANAPSDAATGAAGQQAGTATGGQGQPQGEDRKGEGRPSATRTAINAALDEAARTEGFAPLRDIMQSLPPVLQSQLGVEGVSGTGSVASTGEMLGNKVIDMSVSGQWIDRMAREIATLAEGTGHSRFQLSPPNLGRIQVDLWQDDAKMNMRLLTETDEAARRLRDGQGALENHARLAQLSLGSVSVEKSSSAFESGREQRDAQNQKQGADSNPNGQQQQQASAQAQGQSTQGRGNSSGNLNRGAFAAVIGSEGQAEPAVDVRVVRNGDPRVRFA